MNNKLIKGYLVFTHWVGLWFVFAKSLPPPNIVRIISFYTFCIVAILLKSIILVRKNANSNNIHLHIFDLGITVRIGANLKS